MDDTYNKLPDEIWLEIINFSNEKNLLFTNKSFFELFDFMKVEEDIIECIIKYNLLHILAYIISLGGPESFIIKKNIITTESLNRHFKMSCEKGQYAIVTYLVALGADFRIDNDYGLIHAAKNGHIGVVKYLVSKGANIGANDNCAIKFASENGHLEVVEYLVSKGADINANNNYPIEMASKNGHLKVVEYLVSLGVDIRANDDYVVGLAYYYDHHEVVDYLISQGAVLNKSKYSSSYNAFNLLPADIWIKIVNHTQEVGLLLTNRSFFELLSLINIKVDIIEYISNNNLTDVLKYLVFLKSINHPFCRFIRYSSLDDYLVKSCCEGDLSIIKDLILLGASERKAVMLACQNGHLEIIRYFVSQEVLILNVVIIVQLQ